MYANREVFSNTPLALVVAEVRFTDSPRLRRQDTLDTVAIALEDRFPLVQHWAGVQVNLANLAPADDRQAEAQFEQQQRRMVLVNTEKTESITVTSSSIAYETTAYNDFDDLCTAVAAACEALISAVPHPPALVRVGLRYIDEIRSPNPITDLRAWGKWIDSSLVAPLAIGRDYVPVRTQGLVTFDLGNGSGMNFQYAAIEQGVAVEPMILKRKEFESGPLFVLDFDGFHDFNSDTTVTVNAATVVDVLSTVHTPAGAAFQGAITNDARTLFRGGAT